MSQIINIFSCGKIPQIDYLFRGCPFWDIRCLLNQNKEEKPSWSSLLWYEFGYLDQFGYLLCLLWNVWTCRLYCQYHMSYISSIQCAIVIRVFRRWMWCNFCRLSNYTSWLKYIFSSLSKSWRYQNFNRKSIILPLAKVAVVKLIRAPNLLKTRH